MTKYEVEHTDTFGGESNYCWVNRYTVEASTRLQLVRRVKRECGLTRVKCEVSDFGDMLEIRPKGICQVVFVRFKEECTPQ